MKIITSSSLRSILVLMLTILGLGTSQEAAAQTITHHWKMGDDDSAALLGGLMETTDDSVGSLHLSGLYPQFGSNPPSYTAATSATANAPFSARFRPSNNAGLSSAVDTSLVSSASFFMEFWIRPESTSWPDDYPIVRHGNAVTSGFGFVTSSAVSPYGGSTIMAAFKAPGVTQLFPLPVGEWTHVAVVHDGGQFQVWVNDGIFHGPAASSFTAYDPGSRLFIGALDGVSAFNYIDEVRIGTFTPGTFDLNMLNFPANKIGVDPGPVEFVTLSGSQSRVISAGLLAANRDNSTTSYSGVLSGPGHFQKAGNGVLTLMAASTYGGITNAWQGTLALGVHEALPDASRLLIGKDAVFDLAGYSETVGALDGWGNVTLGTGTLTVGGSGASTVFRGSISGAGGLVKAGAGTLTLAGPNHYTGITTVNAGTLVLDADSTTSGVVLNGGSLDLGGVSRTMASLVQNGGHVLNGTITAGSVSVTSGTLTAGGAVIIPVSGSLHVGAGAVYDSGGGGVSLGSLTGTGNVAMGVGSLTLGEGHASGIFAGNISGSGEVSKTGSGTLTLSGVNTYTGYTHVLGGSLTVASGGIVHTPGTDFVIASTGTGSFVMDGGAVTARAVIIGHDGGTATVTLRGGTLTTGEIARWSIPSSIAFDGGTLRAAGNTSVLLNGFTAGSAVIQSGGLVLNTNGFTVSTPAELTGSGSLIKTGAGTLTLTGASSYSGFTDVTAGSLIIAPGGSIAHPANFLKVQNPAGAFFTVQGGSISVHTSYIGFNVAESGAGSISSGTWTNASGVELGYFPSSAGTLTLTGGTVTAPQVVLGRFGGSALLQLNGGVLETSSIVRYTTPCTFSADGGTLRATGNTVALFNGFTAGSAVIQSGGLTLDTNGYTVSTNAEFTGIGSLTKTGAGTFTLSGNFAHTGNTIVHAGTLTLSSPRLSDSAGVVIASGAVLSLTHNATDTVAALLIDGVPMLGGTWGAVGSGAEHETARITGSGRLFVPLLAFAGWASLHGLNGESSLAAADPDHDGVANLLEFYTGGIPTLSARVSTSLERTPSGIDFTYPRAKGITSVTAIVEWTDDLITWSTSGVSAPTVITDQGATEIVKVSVPLGSGSGRFVRLRVTAP